MGLGGGPVVFKPDFNDVEMNVLGSIPGAPTWYVQNGKSSAGNRFGSHFMPVLLQKIGCKFVLLILATYFTKCVFAPWGKTEVCIFSKD